MLNLIDSLLNKITMYRLMLYYLTGLTVIAILLGLFGLFPYSPVSILVTTGTLIAACYALNTIFAKIFRIPTNIESVYITAFILALIITPTELVAYTAQLPFLLLASAVAMASKYLINWKGKHVFNPAAIGVVATYFILSQGASWWIGGWPMTIFILIGGLLMTRKLQRFDLVLSFLITTLGYTLITTTTLGPIQNLNLQLFNTSLLFFTFVMLTEPLTTPPTRNLRILYGILTGIIFTPGFHIGEFYFTAEIALVVANIFSYAVSPKGKHLLTFQSKQKIAHDTYEFVFTPKQPLAFKPGQYLEWTLGHSKPDMRGNRRYFTVASSPTENDIRLGVKFYEQPSTFKQALNTLETGAKILTGQLAGDFTLPHNPQEKLAFIAGGIGVTPFRSMIKYLVDKNEKRDIVLFYSNKTEAEAAYQDVFRDASNKLGIKIIYINTEKSGFLDATKIQADAPDFLDRTFYISGPHGMVNAFEKTLKSMGVPSRRIKIDFFPGYA